MRVSWASPPLWLNNTSTLPPAQPSSGVELIDSWCLRTALSSSRSWDIPSRGYKREDDWHMSLWLSHCDWCSTNGKNRWDKDKTRKHVLTSILLWERIRLIQYLDIAFINFFYLICNSLRTCFVSVQLFLCLTIFNSVHIPDFYRYWYKQL